MTIASIILIVWMAVGTLVSVFSTVLKETDVPVACGKITGQLAKIALLSLLIYYSGGWQ